MIYNNRKIAVVGIGGVGGYVAGLLAKAYRHVTFVARGARLQAIREHGLTLHSDRNGEMTVVPEQATTLECMGRQDYIFICVKNYSLEDVCRQLSPLVDDHTVIIPVMNGADPAERVRQFIGKGMVIDALIYIVAHGNNDGSVTQQGNVAKIKLGIQDAKEEQWREVEQVSALLSGAAIDHEITRDIQTEIWRKYMTNCAYNVTTAYYNQPIGPLRDDPVKAKEYEALVWEAYEVARAKGISVTQEHAKEIIHDFYNTWADDATSSLQRDIHMGKQSELETFSGYLVREADRLHVPVPMSRKLYAGLKKMM